MTHLMMPNAAIPSLGDNGHNPNIPTGAIPLERRCDNAECTVYKMVSNVPKRKTPQFVTEPVVMDKPLLINGFTTIFQIEGQSAKLSDIKTVDKQRPLYRIVPNTHAHIVNYVVVDSDAESLRKINENDPATMRKLLDSQKQSADQMLRKLIAGHSLPLSTISGTSAAPSSATTTNNSNGVGGGGGGVGVVGSITPISVAKLMPQATPSIQLPPRVHPNLKITAVASADGLSNVANNNSSTTGTTASQLTTIQTQQSTQPVMPMITPIPLANLQRASATSSTHTTPSISNIGMAPTMTPIGGIGVPPNTFGDVVEKPVFDKMQQELQELRRTVALLAEAQAKNKLN